jgi:hypothetical protein
MGGSEPSDIMTPLHAVQLALAMAAGVAAWRRRGPVAWYLSAVVGLDLLRLGLAQLLPPEPPGALSGGLLLARHLSEAAYLGLILAVPALSMALFLRRRPWPVAGAWLAAVLVVVAAYPELRGPELLRAYSALEVVGGLAAVGCFVVWLRRRERLTVDHACGIVLVSASLATVALPPLLGAGTLERWPVIVALHALAFGVVLGLQLWAPRG